MPNLLKMIYTRFILKTTSFKEAKALHTTQATTLSNYLGRGVSNVTDKGK